MKKTWLLLLLLLAAPAAAQDHTPVVARVKAALVASGVDLAGPCGAFQITGRVALELQMEGYGLVFKTGGQNGCSVPEHERYAVDAIMLPNGTTIDILINSETENTPSWQTVGSNPPALWRAPFFMGGVVPPTPGGDAHEQILDLVVDFQAQTNANFDQVDADLAALKALAHPPPGPVVPPAGKPWWMDLFTSDAMKMFLAAIAAILTAVPAVK